MVIIDHLVELRDSGCTLPEFDALCAYLHAAFTVLSRRGRPSPSARSSRRSSGRAQPRACCPAP